MGEENRESRSSEDLIREAKERFKPKEADLDAEGRSDRGEALQPDNGSGPETTSEDSIEASEPAREAAPPNDADTGAQITGRSKRPTGKVMWVLVAGLLIAVRFGLFGDLISDPTGEQFVDQLESELKAGGLSDDTWTCVESGLRDGGYIETLNNVSVSEMNEALESPVAAAPPELAEFLGGFSAFANPHEPTTCVSIDELAGLERPALLLVLAAGVPGAEFKERTTRCDVGYDRIPVYDDLCRVTNAWNPGAGYTLVLHGQLPPGEIDGFVKSGINEYQTDCLAAYLFVVEDDHSPVWTESIRRFTTQGEMTEVCVQTSA